MGGAPRLLPRAIMPSPDITPFVVRQTVAELPVLGADPATIHTFVNGLSFLAAILRLVRQTCVGRFGRQPDMQKELIMIKQDRGIPPAERECMGRPTDMRQSALEVIATTRCAWLSLGAADAPVADRAQIACRVFRIALDAKSSSAARARAIRVRARRRSAWQFAS